MQLFKVYAYEDHSFPVWNLRFFSVYKMLAMHPRFASQSLHQNQLSRREKSWKVKNLPVKTKRLWGWQTHSPWEKKSQKHGAGTIPRESCSRWGFGLCRSPVHQLHVCLLGWARRNRVGKEPRALSQTPGTDRCLLLSSIPSRNLNLR